MKLKRTHQTSDEEGCYQIVLRLRRAATLEVGSLGSLPLAPGYYVYTGSAMRPWTIEKRLRHHRKRRKANRVWHIDHLTSDPRFEIVREIARPSKNREECRINRATARMRGASVPVKNFGNTDDRKGPRRQRCKAHLVYFRHRPIGLPAEASAPGSIRR